MIEPGLRLRARARVVAQRSADTLVLLDLDGGEYYSLTEVSARVWELCDGARPVAEVIAAISDEYDAPPAQVGDDVLAFLQEMVDEKLLVEAD